MGHEWKVGDRVRLEGVIAGVENPSGALHVVFDGAEDVARRVGKQEAQCATLIHRAEPPKLDVTKPMCQTEADVELRMQDILIQTYCTRKGGGWAPILENGVEIKHLPTGISVRCDTERSAHANRASAMKRLLFLIAALAAQETIPEPKRTTTQLVELVPFSDGIRIVEPGDPFKFVGIKSRAKISYTEGEGWSIAEVAL